MVHCSRINAGAKGVQACQGSPWRFSSLGEDPSGAGASRALKHQQGMNSMQQETPGAEPGRLEMVFRLVLGPKQEFLHAGRTRTGTGTEQSIPELQDFCAHTLSSQICTELAQNEDSWVLCAPGQRHHLL